MIGVQLKNLDDFRRVAEGQKTIFERDSDRFTYYAVSGQAGVGIVNMFGSEKSLKFKEGFNIESDAISVEFLVDIEDIFPFHGDLHG